MLRDENVDVLVLDKKDLGHCRGSYLWRVQGSFHRRQFQRRRYFFEEMMLPSRVIKNFIFLKMYIVTFFPRSSVVYEECELCKQDADTDCEIKVDATGSYCLIICEPCSKSLQDSLE